MNGPPSVLAQLMATIEQRKADPPARSYTASLLAGGIEQMGAKVTEEAAEVVEAARTARDVARRSHLIHEAADLFYHLLVLLAHSDIRLDDLETELARRFGVSGLDEKQARDRRKDNGGSGP